MKRKKDYKIIQVGFKTKKQYDEYHKNAVKYYGSDSRLADVAYTRECIKNCKKKSRVSMKEKGKALVESQTLLTEMIHAAKNTTDEEKLMKLSKEILKLWVL